MFLFKMTALNEKDKYKLPDWIGAPPKGTHLDVVKESKLIQKLLIDEKGHYYFGRNPTDCDFVCEHASCSRVHAVLLYHKLIKRFAVVDLESSHGTFIENLRIGALAPVFINVDQSFHFGASKRRYFLRDKLINRNDENDEDVEIETGFSKDQSDMDNATEANTARNRKIGQIPQTEEEARRKLRPRPNVKFNEEEDVINPEDIDPSVGRFRNMVRTAVIPVAGNKRSQQNHDADEQLFDFYSPTEPLKKMKIVSPVKSSSNGSPADRLKMYSSTLGSLTLNAAPDLELYSPALPPPEESMTPAAVAKYGPMAPTSSKRQMFTVSPNIQSPSEDNGCPSKKKYAKEAWPREMRRHNSGVL